MPTNLDTYGPYDSGAGANITEAFWRAMMARAIQSAVAGGALNELNTFGDSTGLQVKVDTGEAWVRGAYGQNTSLKTLGLAAVGGIPGGQSRIDRVILRNDFVNNLMQLDVLTGTAAASPTPPALTQSSSIWEMLLGEIGGAGSSATINNATTTVTAGMVTDGRWKMSPSGILYHERTPAPAGTITLPGAGTLPAGLRLKLWATVRSDAVATDVLAYLNFNGDTGANYQSSAVLGNNSAASASQPGATLTAQPVISRVPAASAGLGSSAATFTAEIFNYQGTSFEKRALCMDEEYASAVAGNEWIEAHSIRWNSSVAITTLLLGLSAGNFTGGSKVVVEVGP